MTHIIEYTTKCRKLFYNRLTGDVIGIVSGGGLLELHGDEFINAVFNDPTASASIGVVEAYYDTPGRVEPRTVDRATVGDLETKSLSLIQHREICVISGSYGKCEECTSLFEEVCNLRDSCVDYVLLEIVEEN